MKPITRVAARKLRLKRYFTGKPCTFGHVCERLVSNFICVKCRNIKVHKLHKGPGRKQHNARLRHWWHKKRGAVLKALGGKCKCCGEKEIVFLALDHTNKDGAAHRKSLGSKTNIAVYYWAHRQIAAGFIKDVKKRLRILCHNCNAAHSSLGYCPYRGIKQ